MKRHHVALLALAAAGAYAASFESTTKGRLVVTCDGTKLSEHNVETEATASIINYATTKGGKANCTITYPLKSVTVALPQVPPTELPPVVSTVALRYSAQANQGPYSNLGGATVGGSIHIRLNIDCATPLATSVTFYQDGTPVWTEAGCPYVFMGDDALFDTKALANGPHKIEASYGTTLIGANFTVQNSTTPPVSLSANVSWTPPILNLDGTAVNLSGFVIYAWPASAPQSPRKIDVSGAGTTSYVVPNLTKETWYFSVAGRTTAGNEGLRSDPASKSF